jgi:hypothetical protein
MEFQDRRFSLKALTNLCSAFLAQRPGLQEEQSWPLNLERI